MTGAGRSGQPLPGLALQASSIAPKARVARSDRVVTAVASSLLPTPTAAGRTQARPAAGRSHLKVVRSVLMFPQEVTRLTTATTTNTTVSQRRTLSNIRTRGIPAMQTPHPLDIATDELAGKARNLILRAFLRPDPDGEVRIDELERAALDAVDGGTGIVLEYRIREVAADGFKRNGFTRLTRDRFRDAGYGLIDLDDARQKPRANVVEFRPRTQDAG